MKTQLLLEENSQANYSGSTYLRRTISLSAILILFFSCFPSFNFICTAQPLNNPSDSISINNLELWSSDSLETEDYNDTYAIGVTSSITGSGQGVYYTPLIIYHSRIGFLALGPTIQKEKMNFSGFQLNYELNLLGKNPTDSNYFDRLELYTFLNGSYQFNAMLSQTSQKNELLALQNNPSPTLLRVFEGYAGVGIRFELFSNLRWFNCIGFGGYKILDAPANLIHEKKGMGLFLRTGISYEFDKNNRITKRETMSTF
ncbi:MAG: hypothetical protein A3F72_13180 [Bacteroidetes bacterium RIFCSPLOWO2_12_FULL_35_15]|nr:MAG: hypothetical protein A3F72_13180 [Bacteroidetes bacterium RIFCSPLOWO2_12_FULL_35_15]